MTCGRGSWPVTMANIFRVIRRSWCKTCPAPRRSSLPIISITSPNRTGSPSARILPAIYFDQLVGRPEVKFDFTKIGWIGSPEQNDILHYMRADLPYRSIDDIRKAKEPPRCGSSGTGTTGFYIPRLLDEVLGTKHTIVSGYAGGSEVDLAVERGEVHCWSPLVATFFGREPYISWHKKGFCPRSATDQP